jgi:lipopolysaccharide transport system permease protein/teichoic acid transport system permease protein
MVAELFRQKPLIISLAKREIANLYVGSALGILWAFIQPLTMILVFWFIFSVGFRVQPSRDVPFVVWLTAGMAPWFYFASIVNGCSSVVVGHANLVKKTLFPSEILPLIKVISNLVTHGFFVSLILLLILIYRIGFSLYWLQAFYYLCCLWIIALGLAWAISAVNVFVRDITHLVAVIIQVGFWATPIFWDIHMMPEQVQFILKLNPLYYIVQGYRDSFIYHVPFWQHPYQTIYFWVLSLFLLVAGAKIFLRLKPQFADVL